MATGRQPLPVAPRTGLTRKVCFGELFRPSPVLHSVQILSVTAKPLAFFNFQGAFLGKGRI